MDGASSGDDAGDAVGCQGDVPQQHASMDGEIVHALQPGSLIALSSTLSRIAQTPPSWLDCCSAWHSLRHPVSRPGHKLQRCWRRRPWDEVRMAAVACLLCLLYEGLPEELPGDVLNDAARLLQALVDGHRPHLQEKCPLLSGPHCFMSLGKSMHNTL